MVLTKKALDAILYCIKTEDICDDDTFKKLKKRILILSEPFFWEDNKKWEK